MRTDVDLGERMCCWWCSRAVGNRDTVVSSERTNKQSGPDSSVGPWPRGSEALIVFLFLSEVQPVDRCAFQRDRTHEHKVINNVDFSLTYN